MHEPTPADDLRDATRYVTAGGVHVTRTVTPADETELDALAAAIDTRRGGVLSSGVDYPGRYSRWHLAYVDPPVEIVARGRRIEARALNGRGRVLLPSIATAMTATGETIAADQDRIEILVRPAASDFAEEDRSRQPTVFTTLRALVGLFASPSDKHLGLYGAYGYDLAFQFEPVRLRHDRDSAAIRDLVLHLPDEILVVDRKRETCVRYSYDFAVASGSTSTTGLTRTGTSGQTSTTGLPRVTEPVPASAPRHVPPAPVPGRYADVVREAKERFLAGDLFEVVPSHVLAGACDSPAAFYERLRRTNPAPYEFFLNLGDGEHLVGASPEMYVRVTGTRVETCPIAGTIRRGADPLEDAAQIQSLLNSAKDDAELTMCTDVDRNDKARVCVAGSVRVIGRRQVELYSRLIHTVDHIEGELRPDMDAFDAFLTHMWAVTVTGAPKQWAMQFIEDHEDAPRRWYGGAIGFVGFDGSMNTGLTLRTAHVEGGVAAVRAGATLLYDSDPDEEERETHLKAQALLEVAAGPGGERGTVARPGSHSADSPTASPVGEGLRVLVVDNQDSFVHTLGDYFRQHGADVTTLRFGFPDNRLDELAPDLVVLSPGPGRPDDFDCGRLLRAVETRRIPVFGVCLGLQAMVEYDGGKLDVLSYPAHGKAGQVRVLGGDLLTGLGETFTAGRYHSLYAAPTEASTFAVTAVITEPDGTTVATAIEDGVRRWWGVQFHPESILTATGQAGHAVIHNVLELCRRPPAVPRVPRRLHAD